MQKLAKEFHGLLSGASNAYGTWEIDAEKRTSVKSVRGTVTNEIWEAHLAGVKNLGVIPIRADGLCSFGVIDIDGQIDLIALASQIERTSLPLIPVRSKSGGAHLYLFAPPMQASDMQEQLRYCAKRLGHPHAEIFPKQAVINVARGDLGSWILMPYFNARYTERYAVDARGERLDAEQFLAAATTMIGAR